jgi:hypothetical protein
MKQIILISTFFQHTKNGFFFFSNCSYNKKIIHKCPTFSEKFQITLLFAVRECIIRIGASIWGRTIPSVATTGGSRPFQWRVVNWGYLLLVFQNRQHFITAVLILKTVVFDKQRQETCMILIKCYRR